MSGPATTLPVDFRLEEGLPSRARSVTHGVVPGGSVAGSCIQVRMRGIHGRRI